MRLDSRIRIIRYIRCRLSLCLRRGYCQVRARDCISTMTLGCDKTSATNAKAATQLEHVTERAILLAAVNRIAVYNYRLHLYIPRSGIAQAGFFAFPLL